MLLILSNHINFTLITVVVFMFYFNELMKPPFSIIPPGFVEIPSRLCWDLIFHFSKHIFWGEYPLLGVTTLLMDKPRTIETNFLNWGECCVVNV